MFEFIKIKSNISISLWEFYQKYFQLLIGLYWHMHPSNAIVFEHKKEKPQHAEREIRHVGKW